MAFIPTIPKEFADPGWLSLERIEGGSSFGRGGRSEVRRQEAAEARRLAEDNKRLQEATRRLEEDNRRLMAEARGEAAKEAAALAGLDIPDPSKVKNATSTPLTDVYKKFGQILFVTTLAQEP